MSVILDKIKSNNDILGNICNINCGIQTGADKVTDKHIEKYKLSSSKNTGIYVLNNHELVVKYNKKLANLNYFLSEINKELFGEIYD